MGFSMEAMVTIPACLALLVTTSSQAAPVSVNLMDTAILAIHASLESQDSDDCCRHYAFEKAGLSLPVVETHPQKVVEALALARDMFRTWGGESP
ncbi:MAG: hypothetical protein GX849_02275 [Clostridiaceae bacterium]|jgi:hypothetical protein|nr:hypothetical protein [Clostridiaceae bacterium]